MGTSLSTGEIAASFGTTARTLRKFFRSPQSPFEAVGQGSRYNIGIEDLDDLRTKFEAWVSRPGSRSTSKAEGSEPAKAAKRSKAVPQRRNPLDEDDLKTRLNGSILDRRRAHHMTCNFSWKHSKVAGLDLSCKHDTINNTAFCAMHQQITFCGDLDTPQPGYCGPGPHPKPFCKWHNGEISEEELEAHLAKPVEEWDK